jgi:hypothetical protein
LAFRPTVPSGTAIKKRDAAGSGQHAAAELRHMAEPDKLDAVAVSDVLGAAGDGGRPI